MEGLSERFRAAVDYVKARGYERSDAAVARRLGTTCSTLCMELNGDRRPTWDRLLRFCDAYPVNFAWLRTGEGDMVDAVRDRETELLARIAELEEEVARLKGTVK